VASRRSIRRGNPNGTPGPKEPIARSIISRAKFGSFAAKTEGHLAIAITNKAQHRALDHDPGRHQSAAQQRIEAKIDRGPGEGRNRLAVRPRQTNTTDLQIESPLAGVDGKSDSRYCDMNAAGRAVEIVLDIRCQPVELDRALGQAPQAEPEEKHQRRRERAGRQNEPMRSPAQARTGRLPQSGAASSDGGLVLTRWFEPASVPLAPDLG
jgi:hypothetical protein